MESGRLAAVSDTPRTAIVAAMPEEVAPLLGRLTNRSRTSLAAASSSAESSGASLSLTSGLLGGEPVAVLVTGDGAKRARCGVKALLEAARPGRLLAVGCAGGLSPELGPADLIMARRVVAADGSGREAPEASGSAARAAGARLGTVVTVDRLVLTSEEKRRLRESLVPGGEASVVDLESACYAEAAAEAGVPWTVIRAVHDTASEDLPDFLHACTGPGGEIRRPAVLRHAARHPRAIPDLFRMWSRIEPCGRALAAAVAGYVAASRGGVSASGSVSEVSASGVSAAGVAV